MSEVFRFPFKGNRKYIHGTTLLCALIQAAGRRGLNAGTMDVSFRHMILNSACVLEQRVPCASDAVVAKVSANYESCFSLCINAAPYESESDRVDFDEAEVCRGATLGEKYIVQERPHHQDGIELLVALCKKMHQECVDASKNWVFSRYDGEFPILVPEKVELKITKQVGTRLTCSDVIFNGRRIGSVYFS